MATILLMLSNLNWDYSKSLNFWINSEISISSMNWDFLIWIDYFLKLVRVQYQCLEFDMTSHFKRSFLLTLTPIAMLYVMTLLVPTLSKFSLNLVKIQYQLDQNSDTLQFFNGSRLGINASTVTLLIRYLTMAHLQQHRQWTLHHIQ